MSQGNQEKPRTASGLSASQDVGGSDSRTELERLMEQYGSSLLRMSALYLKDAPAFRQLSRGEFRKDLADGHMRQYMPGYPEDRMVPPPEPD